jgi:hypothetical protein
MCMPNPHHVVTPTTRPLSHGFYLVSLIFPAQPETRIGYRPSKEIDWHYFYVMGAKFGGEDDFRGSTFFNYVYFVFSNQNNTLKKTG